MTTLQFNPILKVCTYVVYMFLVIVTGVLFWTSYRGLDITDESFYLVGYLYGIEPAHGLTFFHRIYSKFFGAFDFSVPQIRILRICLSILASVLLADALVKFLKSKQLIDERKWLFHFALGSLSIGSLLGYTWLPQTPSYNTFSSLFLQLILVFYLYAEVYHHYLKRSAFQLLVGFTLSASFYNKFPNMVTSLGAIIFFSLCIRSHLSWKMRALSVAKDLALYAVGALIFSLIIFDGEVWGGLSDYISLLSSGSSGNTDFIQIYSADFMRLLSRMWIYLLAISIYVIFCLTLRPKLQNKVLNFIVDSLPTLFIIGFIWLNTSYFGGADRKYLHFDFYFILCIWCIGFLIIRRRTWQNNFGLLILICIFFASFLSGSLGTNNGLTVQFMIYLVFPIAAILVILFSSKYVNMAILATIMVVTGSIQIITGMIFNPYREVHGILAQKNVVKNVRGLEQLELDSATFTLKQQLESVKDLSPTHIFIFSHQTGAALFTEKIPFAFGWHDEYDPAFCSKVLEKSARVAAEDIIFAIPSNLNIDDVILQTFKKIGVNFPDQYTIIKQIQFEDCQDKQIKILNIYVHQSLKMSPA